MLVKEDPGCLVGSCDMRDARSVGPAVVIVPSALTGATASDIEGEIRWLE